MNRKLRKHLKKERKIMKKNKLEQVGGTNVTVIYFHKSNKLVRL